MPKACKTFSVCFPHLALPMLLISLPASSVLISIRICIYSQSLFLAVSYLALVYISIFVGYLALTVKIAKPLSLNAVPVLKQIFSIADPNSIDVLAMEMISVREHHIAVFGAYVVIHPLPHENVSRCVP